jgi:hypothetical protein
MNFDLLHKMGKLFVYPQNPSPESSVQVLEEESVVVPVGAVTLDELARCCKEQPINYLVEGLLPAEDVHVAVGDSGLGKTPWAYQLGLCVASGIHTFEYGLKQTGMANR